MTPEEFERYYPYLDAWIAQTLAAHKGSARSVASAGFPHLPLYFTSGLLQAAKFVIVNRVPMPPLSAMGLERFAEFEHGDFDGITYLDTFFVKADRAEDESLYLHEMIHIIQWRALGRARFLKVYADGLETFSYEQSPLEQMAYQAQDAFSAHRKFDAEKWAFDQLKPMIGA